MNRRLDQIERKLEQQTGGDFCRHAGHVQVIEKDPDGSREHKKTEPEPCAECGLYPPVSLHIIISAEKEGKEQ